MSEKTKARNRARARRVESMIQSYPLYGTYSGDASSEMATDVVTDMLHWCRANGADPEAVLRMTQGNFSAEESGEEEG